MNPDEAGGADAISIDLASLAAWLTSQGVEVAGPLSASLLTGGKSNLTYKLSDGIHEWVLRRPPLGGYTPSAHDVVREYQVTCALGRTTVPVPRSVAASKDPAIIGTPFAVVEFVTGTAIRTADELAELSPATLDRVVGGLVDALATLHQVDFESVGLTDFGKPYGYAARQLRRWSGQWELVGGRATRGAMAAAVDTIERLRKVIPIQRYARVVHGDYRIDNTLVDLETGQVKAIVDWELSTIGDPVADVALMCVYRKPALDAVLGFDAAWTSTALPPPQRLAERYTEAGGVPLTNWEFWMALSSYKLAVIAAGIDYRQRSGGTVGPGFDTARDAVEPLMAEALRHAGMIRG